jgi:hypothetical protein
VVQVCDVDDCLSCVSLAQGFLSVSRPWRTRSFSIFIFLSVSLPSHRDSSFIFGIHFSSERHVPSENEKTLRWSHDDNVLKSIGILSCGNYPFPMPYTLPFFRETTYITKSLLGLFKFRLERHTICPSQFSFTKSWTPPEHFLPFLDILRGQLVKLTHRMRLYSLQCFIVMRVSLHPISRDAKIKSADNR